MPFNNINLNDGTSIPSIAFGTGSVNKGIDVHEYIENALEAGFSHIDTAQVYDNEESVGIALRESGLNRSEVYITTKWNVWRHALCVADREALQKLGLKYVDLFLIHAPYLLNGDMEGIWRQFEEIREAGLARSIGVSNFKLKDLKELFKIAHVKPAVNQILFHPYNWAENKELLAFQTEHGIVTEAYSSLTPITRHPGGPVDAALKAPAKRLYATPAQVLFAWVKAKGAVIVTTTSKPDRLEEYLDVGDLYLTPEEVDAIDAAGYQTAGLLFLRLGRYWFHILFIGILLVMMLYRFLIVLIAELANMP